MDPDFWISLTICVALVGTSLVMIRRHWERWEAVEADASLGERDRDHLRRRYRRRIQTSTMLGIAGVAILGGRLFPPEDGGVVVAAYWFGLLLLVLWMVVLALVDIVSTRLYFGMVRRNVQIERAKLEAQLHRLRRVEGNGADDRPAVPSADREGRAESPDEESAQ